jgi:hypothetical protein
MFADLHSQPAHRNYNGQSRRERNTDVLSPQDGKHELAGASPRGSEIVIASLSPKEKGFFTGTEGRCLDRIAMSQFYECLASGDSRKVAKWMHDHNVDSPQAGRNKYKWLRALPFQLSNPRSGYLGTGEYDYFEELKLQYKAYRLKVNLGDYQLAPPGHDFKKNITADPPTILFSIQGIHSLGVGNPEDEFPEEGQPKLNISLGKLKSRIHQIKGEEPLEDAKLKRWEHPPLLFRLAHHFGNGIFGHARSLPENACVLFDQRRNLNKGVIKSSGYEIVRELLGLDEELRPTGSRRILVDMLHLSAASRNDLYERIFRIYNKNIDPENPIPVVFNGAAYSGVDFLLEMVKNSHDGTEKDSFRMNGYYGGGINLSDEDILAVFWSHGHISLTMERIKLGDELAGLEKVFSNSARSKALRLLGRQIAGIVSVPFAYHLPSPLKIWDCLSIAQASQNRGEVMEHFRHTSGLETLTQDVEEVLSKLKKEEPFWFGGHKPFELAEKICSDNVRNFVSSHFDKVQR